MCLQLETILGLIKGNLPFVSKYEAGEGATEGTGTMLASEGSENNFEK